MSLILTSPLPFCTLWGHDCYPPGQSRLQGRWVRKVNIQLFPVSVVEIPRGRREHNSGQYHPTYVCWVKFFHHASDDVILLTPKLYISIWLPLRGQLFAWHLNPLIWPVFVALSPAKFSFNALNTMLHPNQIRPCKFFSLPICFSSFVFS